MKKQKMVTLEISEELHKKLCTIQLMQKELHGKREQLRKILERLIITENDILYNEYLQYRNTSK